LSSAGRLVSSPARELRMGSSRSIVAPVVRLTSPSSVPVVQTSSCCPIAESLDAVIDHRRSMLRFLSPACRRSPDQASRNRTSRAFVCRVVCLMWNACPKLTGRCTSCSCQESTEGSGRLKVAPPSHLFVGVCTQIQITPPSDTIFSHQRASDEYRITAESLIIHAPLFSTRRPQMRVDCPMRTDLWCDAVRSLRKGSMTTHGCSAALLLGSVRTHGTDSTSSSITLSWQLLFLLVLHISSAFLDVSCLLDADGSLM